MGSLSQRPVTCALAGSVHFADTANLMLVSKAIRNAVVDVRERDIAKEVSYQRDKDGLLELRKPDLQRKPR